MSVTREHRCFANFLNPKGGMPRGLSLEFNLIWLKSGTNWNDLRCANESLDCLVKIVILFPVHFRLRTIT